MLPTILFQLTTSRRGRQLFQFTLLNAAKFQLTTSRRGRPTREYQGGKYLHFNSRPHEEVDLLENLCIRLPIYFNSRPHEEVDYQCWQLLDRLNYFNSRPHEEVDLFLCAVIYGVYISTHDLTKRSTVICATPLWSCIFQLTTSRRGRLIESK